MRVRINTGSFIYGLIVAATFYVVPVLAESSTNDNIARKELSASNSKESVPTPAAPVEQNLVLLQPTEFSAAAPSPELTKNESPTNKNPYNTNPYDANSYVAPTTEKPQPIYTIKHEPPRPQQLSTALPITDLPTAASMATQENALQGGDATKEGMPKTEIANSVPKSLDGRVMALENENRTLQLQFTQTNARIDLMEKELAVMVQKTKENTPGKIYQQIDRLKNHMGSQLFIIVASCVALFSLLLLVRIFTPRRKNSVTTNYHHMVDPSGKKSATANYQQNISRNPEQNLDFMAGQEGSTAKLNLARAYIEMGSADKAEEILSDVLSHGTDFEQKEAKELLEKIGHPTIV